MKTLRGIIMKANPPLLLLALVTGCFAIHAHADSESSIGGCTTSIVSTCGVQVVKTVCSSGNPTQDNDKDEGYEHHGSDDGHSDRTQTKDINESDGVNTYRKDDTISPSFYAGQQQKYDFSYTDPYGVSHNVDWKQRLGTSPDGKITICHRMGGARVTLDVPDDQMYGAKAHGHGIHPLDTFGRCEDQEDAEGNDDPAKIAAATPLSQGSSISASMTACLAVPAGTNVTVTLPNGSTWTGPAPGCNASGVSCSVPVVAPGTAGVKSLN